MTLIEKARRGKITSEMRGVAKKEQVSLEFLRDNISKGRIVIPKNRYRKIKHICGIGKGLSTKINANIGTSPQKANIKNELKKVREALKAGADTIMDLSCGGNISQIRQAILKESAVPLGTVPIYEAIVEGIKKHKELRKIDKEIFFDVIERQAEDGVDFMTIHAGVTRKAISKLRRQGRVTGIVSRGGAFIVEWMMGQKKENPFYTEFDRLLEIARRYDITLSLGDGLRPGCISDATDEAQVQELITLGELAVRARKKGVQVIIEGPGHLPLDHIEANVKLEKKVCKEAPFYVLGPLVTDIAPGYDHITSAIGGAIAASAGADFLCYVTPAEHLKIPSLDDVKEGIIACQIAAHAADIGKGVKNADKHDYAMSKARAELDWEQMFDLALDQEKPRRYRAESKPALENSCSMCGDMCAIKNMNSIMDGEKVILSRE